VYSANDNKNVKRAIKVLRFEDNKEFTKILKELMTLSANHH
jgi:hypothetical protein